MVKDHTSDINRLVLAFKHEDDDTFPTMVHVSLCIRDYMLSHPNPKWIDFSDDTAMDCIPHSLYMFLNLILCGQPLNDDNNEARLQLRIKHCSGSYVYS